VEKEPPIPNDRWAERASGAVARRLERTAAPWRRGLWVTARVSYRPRPLSSRFEVGAVEVEGARRRLARAAGSGPPLLILPGLHATLDEGLFSQLADAAADTGREVLLLEDRCAGPTLALNGGEAVGLQRQGTELAALLESLDVRPDVLALSAGAAVALSTPRRRLGRIAAWSATLDPATTAARVQASPILRGYYRRVMRRAWTASRRPAPEPADFWSLLMADPLPEPEGPLLLVHTVDDPVAPVESVRAVRGRVGVEVLVLRCGGHLGFSAVDGVGAYLSPWSVRGNSLDRRPVRS